MGPIAAVFTILLQFPSNITLYALRNFVLSWSILHARASPAPLAAPDLVGDVPQHHGCVEYPDMGVRSAPPVIEEVSYSHTLSETIPYGGQLFTREARVGGQLGSTERLDIGPVYYGEEAQEIARVPSIVVTPEVPLILQRQWPKLLRYAPQAETLLSLRGRDDRKNQPSSYCRATNPTLTTLLWALSVRVRLVLHALTM